MVKASKLIQMKLTPYRLKVVLEAFRKFSAFVLMPIWLPRQRHFTEEEILEKAFTLLHEVSVTSGKSSQTNPK